MASSSWDSSAAESVVLGAAAVSPSPSCRAYGTPTLSHYSRTMFVEVINDSVS